MARVDLIAVAVGDPISICCAVRSGHIEVENGPKRPKAGDARLLILTQGLLGRSWNEWGGTLCSSLKVALAEL